MIRAKSEIQITELHQRAFHRFIDEEAAKQTNMENILLKAIPHVDEEKSDPENIETDWLTNFFDKCRIVSDEDMQQLWARAIAGEANNPGSFSRRTVNLLSDLDKRDAELFRNLCSFVWIIGSLRPLLFDTQHDIYNRRGIDFNSLRQLESLGLVNFDDLSGFKGIQYQKRLGFLTTADPWN